MCNVIIIQGVNYSEWSKNRSVTWIGEYMDRSPLKDYVLDFVTMLFEGTGPTGGPIFDLPPYFNRRDFRCGCGCGSDSIDSELIRVLSRVRKHFGKKLIIISGSRCRKHPSRGDKGREYHLSGKAADFSIKGITTKEIAEYLNMVYNKKYGVGISKKYIHLDVRSGFNRWEF